MYHAVVDRHESATCGSSPCSSWMSESWVRTLTIAQRAALLKKMPAARCGQPLSQAARRKLDQWREFLSLEVSEHRYPFCRIDDLSLAEFKNLLAVDASTWSRQVVSCENWMQSLERTYDKTQDAKRQDAESESSYSVDGFLNLAAPLIHQATNALKRHARQLTHKYEVSLVCPDSIATIFLPMLQSALRNIIERTLVLELHVQKLRGELEGETSEDRFHSFATRLRRREVAASIFAEYPVLAKRMVATVDQWWSYSRDFITQLCRDTPSLQETFADETPLGKLVAIEAQAGDRHRDGKSVAIAHFHGGRRLVYKPRSLSVDVHFQQLLTWLNQRGAAPRFRTLRVLDRGDHGWVEFVESSDCQTRAQVRDFYRRQGGYLAILYALRATDFHYENIIAAGEHPVLIDLETLFHPRMLGDTDSTNANQLALNCLSESVFTTGLLPHLAAFAGQSVEVDQSALGASDDEITLDAVPSWDSVATDEMRFVRVRRTVRGQHCRPIFEGRVVDYGDYSDDLQLGFAHVYQILRQQRDELLHRQGPIASFVDDEVRVVLRATRDYGLLLRESCRPDWLRDELDRDRLFEVLWGSVDLQPHLRRVVASERDQLRRGDVPLFATQPGSVDLTAGCGKRVPEYFSEPAIDTTVRHIEKFSEEDLDLQLRLIQSSYSVAAMSRSGARWPSSASNGEGQATSPERLLRAAEKVGDRLEKLAIRHDEDASWLGLVCTGNQGWRVAPLGIDLYSGLPGVVLFLAHLGKITGKERYTQLAKAGTSMTLKLVEANRENIQSIGAFEGWGGILYTLSHLVRLWHDERLMTTCQNTLPQLTKLIEGDDLLDVIGGTAGLIAGLHSFRQLCDTPSTDAVLQRCGERLATAARRMDCGVGWETSIPSGQPLTGFSHGAAGMAWALYKLNAIDDGRFHKLASSALAYERSCYSTKNGNWPDYRQRPAAAGSEDQTDPQFMVGWCHGAAGIGFARLGCLPYDMSDEIDDEIMAAVTTTLDSGFGASHCLCHGELGNLDFLLSAATLFQDEDLLSRVYRRAAGILDSICEQGWLCGVPLGAETPGLMTGLSGIGLGLLRLADPGRVPSVLSLTGLDEL